MLSIVEFKTTALDHGIPGITATHMLLLFLLMLAVSMIPYLFLFLSLLDQKSRPSTSRKMFAWVHWHRHPELLHH